MKQEELALWFWGQASAWKERTLLERLFLGEILVKQASPRGTKLWTCLKSFSELFKKKNTGEF